MCRRAGIILLAIFTTAFSVDASTSPADPTFTTASASAPASPIKSRFDLPAGPLDKALRDFAVQANCNISYEPAIVAGLQVQAIKGEFTPGGVLARMLTGTKLRAVNVNEDTIQILEKQTPSPDGSTSRNGHSSDADVLHIAMAGADLPAATAPSSAAEPAASPTAEESARDKNELDVIVVTGTHIRGVAVASPVIEIGREEIDRSGYTSIADVMLSLPQNFGGGYNAGGIVNNSQVNSRYADNPTGASVPNLRGLGAGSTLALLDGHRMAAGLPGGGADISSIPIDAVERIEVVTDSASAIYGSDAVAGVVNLILKKNYDGAATSLSYGFAPDGGGTQKRASQIYGTHWNGGNVLVAYEYQHQDAVDARDRDFSSSAAEPNSLLPQTKTNSVTMSASQDLSTSTSAFVDALYIDRDADNFLTGRGFPAPAESPSALSKYAVTAGLNFDLMLDWKATLFFDSAHDATESRSSFLTTPIATHRYDERLSGSVRDVEANANGAITTLPTGIVRLALGAGYRKEDFSDRIGSTSASLANAATGNRNIRYAFGELSIPLMEQSQRAGRNALELVVSARNERYSDFGGKTVPKVGLVYVPVDSIKLRTTWGKAFRAPNLYDIYGIPQLVILDLPNTASSTASSTVLTRLGGDPSLRPETATAWSIGADFFSPNIRGPHVSTTFFDIKYTNRIASIANLFTALSDPFNAFFVTPSSSASAQSLYEGYPPKQIFNATRGAFDPAKIGAIVDARMVNVASQTARGTDLTIDYDIGTEEHGGMVFLNGTYLDLVQQTTPKSSEQILSGLAFYPPKFRLRGGSTWKFSPWTLTGIVNYLPREINNQVRPFQGVGSWTTVDASLRFAPILPRPLAGLHISLAVLNAFNRDPPNIVTSIRGFNYDPLNTSPLGRFVSLHLSKEW